MTFAARIRAALGTADPANDPVWRELEEMAESSPEAAVALICELAATSITPQQRGLLAAGPLRSAIAAANPSEEEAMDRLASTDATLALLLDALLRYENKQRAVVAVLEGDDPGDLSPGRIDQQVVIPNLHEQYSAPTLDEEAWTKIVKAIHAAPETQRFMLATTIVEPLLLRNETAFHDAILDQTRSDPVFRTVLSCCDLSFSEGFLDELLMALSNQSPPVPNSSGNENAAE